MAAAIPFIGMGLGAYGSMAGGMDKNAMYQAEAAGKRAQSAQVQIAQDREVALTEERFQMVRGAQLTAFGKSGVSASTGSPLEQLEITAANAAGEIQAIKQAGQYRKTSLLTEGMYSEMAGEQALNAGFIGSLSSIVGGVGDMSKDSAGVRRANQSQGGFYGGRR